MESGRGGGGGLGGGWLGPDPDEPIGGEGGRFGVGHEIRAAAEAGLSKADVELDVDKLAGHSFTLLGSLCPSSSDGLGGNDGSGGRHPWDGESLKTFHVRRAASGGLEAVTQTRDDGLPLVQVTPMRQVGLGWQLEGVMTCAFLQYDFEDAYETGRSRSPLMHVVFRRENDTAELSAVVAARVYTLSLLSEAKLDESPPTIGRLDARGTAGIDEVYPGPFPDFMFSEPVPPDTVVKITRDQGASAEVHPYLQNGYLVGFGVYDWLSSNFQLDIELRDLAGNEAHYSAPYPGISIVQSAGDFEADPSELDRSYFDNYSWDIFADCDTDVRESVDPGVAALAGTASFLAGGYGYCSAWLRFKAKPTDTKLSFEARLIGELSAPVKVCVSSLGIGGDELCSTFETGWSADTKFPLTPTPVSSVRTLTVDVPSGAIDVLVELDPGLSDTRLWIDSLRGSAE